ncbi:MAG: hypothetical protein E6H06_20830 [Bacteroidetes bacterium]|nr:MAG: hypothetical protein E6H06_20830 [Bacteroidota bacterium]
MKNYKIILLLFIAAVFILTGFKEIKITKIPAADKWTGTVTQLVTSKTKGRIVANSILGENISKWDKFFAFHIDANFVNSRGTVIRADTINNWELDSMATGPRGIPPYIVDERTIRSYCNGKDIFGLDVQFSEDKKTYSINFFTSDCKGLRSSEEKNTVTGNSSDTSPSDMDGLILTIPPFPGHPVGNDPNILSGKYDEIIAAPNDPGGGDIITRITWNLKKSK